ncbi:MAG: Nudix family hydrolase [Gammaproteobacteria bacterium]|nr:Nudix family hydrolase [Gammaproteobacteria bacterium]
MSQPLPVLPVATAAIFNPRGEVLISLRPSHVHQGGLWEFPGGKREPGETARSALARELHEELGITPVAARPLIRVRHDYPDRTVVLDVWRVDAFQGEPHGREGQRLDWVAPEALVLRRFPAADRAIVNAVRLPALYMITSDPAGDPARFLALMEERLRTGIRLVQLRAKTLREDAYQSLAGQAVSLCRRYGARVLLNADPKLARLLDADGVHLTRERLLALRERPLEQARWVAASCHDAAELAHARRVGVDFAVLAPVRSTASHPGARPLGWEGFQALAGEASLPVYALGGVTPDDLETAYRSGAQGIAAIRALWGAEAGS